MKPFPLEWPKTKERTPVGERRHSQFGRNGKLDWDRLMRELEREIEMLGGRNAIVSSNQPLRLDGRPRAENVTILDPGVALYFTLDDMPIALACDQWLSVRENIRAITLHLQSMRGQERWGVGTKRQAFSGYSGLARTSVEEWRLVLGFTRAASVNRADIDQAYRQHAKEAHPDQGGSPEAMARLNAARDAAYQDVRS